MSTVDLNSVTTESISRIVSFFYNFTKTSYFQAIFNDDFDKFQSYTLAGTDFPTVDISRLDKEQDDFWSLGVGNFVADRIYVSLADEKSHFQNRQFKKNCFSIQKSQLASAGFGENQVFRLQSRFSSANREKLTLWKASSFLLQVQ